MRSRVFVFVIIVIILGIYTPPAMAAPPSDGRIHVVQAGETLNSIARMYGLSIESIAAANGLANPNFIYSGQHLAIPGGSDGPPANPVGGYTAHVVQPGETLSFIASYYGTTVYALIEANDIYNPDQIYVGQRLTIPGQTGSQPPATNAPAKSRHVVQAGDTLWGVAYRYNVPVWALAQVNGLSTNSFLYVGQVLKIPGEGTGGTGGPVTNTPASNSGKRIVMDISEQHLYAYDGDRLVFSFVASSGLPGMDTARGEFEVLTKIPNAYASIWDLQMPYWLGIYRVGNLENGIHALPILSNGQTLWENVLGSPASFGCIILRTEDARSLYNWAEIGTPVSVRN